MVGKILIVGSLNMDMVIELDSMPKVGETVLAETLNYIPGGKGANQTFAAGKLGGNVTMLGCVGEDSFGDTLRQSLSGSGADVSAVRRVENLPTGTAVIYVNSEGDNSIVVVQGANGACDIPYLREHDDLIAQTDYVMLQMEIPYEAAFYTIRRAGELGKTVIWNPAPAPAPEDIPGDIWGKVSYITPNETELLKLSGQTVMNSDSVKNGAELLHKKGVANVLVTLGDKGVYFYDGQEEKRFPARKVEAIDTTAAGDCFSGAFVVALSEGKSIEEAVTFANASSSLAVMKKGAQSSIPSREEVEKLIK